MNLKIHNTELHTQPVPPKASSEKILKKTRAQSESRHLDRSFANHQSVSFWHCDESSKGSGREARFASGRFWRWPPDVVLKSSMRVRAATPRRARRGPNT
ncbi:hypothetical protein Baya_3136 [Bagarius yarrelli]|uniref:Uncharacterized protein n=1 Tax=Bagarius yarrelli TaxID=175774 RepID=A0A556TUJ1_BAGYA|nr:hypothetical protein Baya_3136 [Bagarius yarrelli]